MKSIKPKARFSKSHLSVFLIIFAVLGLVLLIKTLAAPNPNLPGDLNNDNTVNIQDLSILLSNYNTSNSTADINSDGTVNILDLSTLLSHYGQDYSPPAGNSIYWGAYIEGQSTYGYYFPSGAPWSNAPLVDPGTSDPWTKFESDAGKKVSLLMFGQPNPWVQSFDSSPFNAVYNRGAIPVVDMSTGSTLLTDISSGKYDSQITAWAQAAKNWGHPFFLRLDAEMNGTWYNFGAQARSNPQSFVNMWRHFHDIFTSVGANNVTWHWCPNVDPENVQTPLEQLYPGDAYVDWTGMTGYDQESGETVSWLFDSTYNRLVALAPTKPIQIGETGANDAGYPGMKVQYIQNFFSALPTKYPKVRAFVWFNWRIDEGSGYWDWPIESSVATGSGGLQSFQSAISSSYYQNGSSEKTFPLNSKVPIP
jgi:hypothetical protein